MLLVSFFKTDDQGIFISKYLLIGMKIKLRNFGINGNSL